MTVRMAKVAYQSETCRLGHAEPAGAQAGSRQLRQDQAPLHVRGHVQQDGQLQQHLLWRPEGLLDEDWLLRWNRCDNKYTKEE